MDSMIKALDIHKNFTMGKSEIEILKGINLEINSGEFVALMGPSGSGKSTLLYILGGLDKPTSGNVTVADEPLSGMSDKEESIMRRRNMGFIFQFYNLIPNMTVEENILLPILLDGKKVRDYENKLAEILQIVNLADRKKHKPSELSGGQQQRVAIARALINNPDIILADEPTGNLDSKSGEEILQLLRKINLEQQKTIVMVTHSTSAAQYGNRIISLKDGILS